MSWSVESLEGSSWVNNWTTTDSNGRESPTTFATKAEAQAELDDFFDSVSEFSDGYRRDEYRIVGWDSSPRRWLGEPVQVHWDHQEYLLYRSGLTPEQAEKYDENHDADPYTDGLVIELSEGPLYNVLIDRSYFAFNNLGEAEQCLADGMQELGLEPLDTPGENKKWT